jgi:hypothetical protein
MASIAKANSLKRRRCVLESSSRRLVGQRAYIHNHSPGLRQRNVPLVMLDEQSISEGSRPPTRADPQTLRTPFPLDVVSGRRDTQTVLLRFQVTLQQFRRGHHHFCKYAKLKENGRIKWRRDLR